MTSLVLLVILFISQLSATSSFSFHGFTSTNLSLDGLTQIEPGGRLRLSAISDSSPYRSTGHAFYTSQSPLVFKNSSNSTAYSFSTHFVFQIVPRTSQLSGQGMAFVISPTMGLPESSPEGFLGLINVNNNGNSSNHIFAIELDTLQNNLLQDINSNHVGIDINTVISQTSSVARYYHDQNGNFDELRLASGQSMQVWVDYNATSQTIDVSLALTNTQRPRIPLLSLKYDLSTVLNQNMYVGFSTGAGDSSYYVLGWSFSINGDAPPLDLSRLPSPWIMPDPPLTLFLKFGLPVIVILSLIRVSLAWVCHIRKKYAEVIEGWELEYISHRFKYKDLYSATKGFKRTQVIGKGGFGEVYRGVLSGSNTEVGIKRVSHESKQGVREFVAEIATLGRLRHRNLVPLLGYCRRKKELLLVYEYMPNGSFEKYLHKQCETKLGWAQRYHIIKGVACGLHYLHEDWEQVVIHRDIKPSNVLLDGKWNARLGDFGLAKLSDHGVDPATTRIVGTLGYLAPEHTKTSKATKSSDVYGFGVLLLEVVTGRRPIQDNIWVVGWVHSLWNGDEIMSCVDLKLEGDFCKEQVEFVLKLGLLCCHIRPEIRPSMRDVVMYLEDPATLPENLFSDRHKFLYEDDVHSVSLPSEPISHSGAYSISNSVLAVGR